MVARTVDVSRFAARSRRVLAALASLLTVRLAKLKPPRSTEPGAMKSKKPAWCVGGKAGGCTGQKDCGREESFVGGPSGRFYEGKGGSCAKGGRASWRPRLSSPSNHFAVHNLHRVCSTFRVPPRFPVFSPFYSVLCSWRCTRKSKPYKANVPRGRPPFSGRLLGRTVAEGTKTALPLAVFASRE